MLAELVKMRVFDWGGIYQNDINRYLVDKYIKKVTDYDVLRHKIETEALPALTGFVLCSWYNHWTSLLIEDIFKDHRRVLPTVGLMKQVDFFVEDIPFDLKVTYFPVGYLEEQRKQRGLPTEEVADLKAACKRFGISFDVKRPPVELKLDMLTALSESTELAVQAYYHAFTQMRQEIIADAIAHPRPLLKWLY